jgi:hypothetical protein
MTWKEIQLLIIAICKMIEQILQGPLGDILKDELSRS